MLFLFFQIVVAQQFSQECSKAAAMASTAMMDAKESLRAYTEAQPDIKNKLASSLGLYDQLDPALYKLEAVPSQGQREKIRNTSRDLRTAAKLITEVVTPTDAQSSDVIEDVNILDFTLQDMVRNCPFIA